MERGRRSTGGMGVSYDFVNREVFSTRCGIIFKVFKFTTLHILGRYMPFKLSLKEKEAERGRRRRGRKKKKGAEEALRRIAWKMLKYEPAASSISSFRGRCEEIAFQQQMVAALSARPEVFLRFAKAANKDLYFPSVSCVTWSSESDGKLLRRCPF